MQASVASLDLQAAPADQAPAIERDTRKIASLEELDKFFGGIAAFQNVSFDLHAGQVLALLGESGAGKSTFANLLTGVHSRDTGQILIDGSPEVSASPRGNAQAWRSCHSSHPSLFGDLTVCGNTFMSRVPFPYLAWHSR